MARKAARWNVVLTCAARKSCAAIPGLSARELPVGEFDARKQHWIDRLRAVRKDKRVPALSFYQGDHWTTVKGLLGDSRPKGFRVNVYIASAGCGLVAPQTSLPPYAATFAGNHPDSVATSAQQRSGWWKSVNEAVSFSDGPRTLVETVRANRDAGLLVAASPEYLQAMLLDIEQAASLMKHAESLILLCRTGVVLGSLEYAHLETDASLSSVLGGSLASMNARLVRWLLAELGESLNRRTAASALATLRSRCDRITRASRIKMADDEIKVFIRQWREETQQATCSSSLAALRQRGSAAEQSRFSRLYRECLQEAIGA